MVFLQVTVPVEYCAAAAVNFFFVYSFLFVWVHIAATCALYIILIFLKRISHQIDDGSVIYLKWTDRRQKLTILHLFMDEADL